MSDKATRDELAKVIDPYAYSDAKDAALFKVNALGLADRLLQEYNVTRKCPKCGE